METLNKISSTDVEKVARELHILINKETINKVIELYPSYVMEEPNDNWSSIVEQILYDLLD